MFKERKGKGGREPVRYFLVLQEWILEEILILIIQPRWADNLLSSSRCSAVCGNVQLSKTCKYKSSSNVHSIFMQCSSNVHPDHPRCGDLSEVDKPSTWDLGPRILQVSPTRFQIHFRYSVTKQDTFEIVSNPYHFPPIAKILRRSRTSASTG